MTTESFLKSSFTADGVAISNLKMPCFTFSRRDPSIPPNDKMVQTREEMVFSLKVDKVEIFGGHCELSDLYQYKINAEKARSIAIIEYANRLIVEANNHGQPPETEPIP